MSMKPIAKGSTVKYQGGYYRVSKLTGLTCNLAGVFNDKVYHKGVPLNQVVEAADEWYARWQESETYRSM